MPRHPRFILVGHPQHVIIRGNNREPVFYADEDYRFYLEKLQAACEKHTCDIHAYVLMTNHIHLLITPHKEDGISKTMQMIGRYYVQYFIPISAQGHYGKAVIKPRSLIANNTPSPVTAI